MRKMDKFYNKVAERIKETEKLGKYYVVSNAHFGEDETKNVMVDVRRLAYKKIDRAERLFENGMITEKEKEEIIDLNKSIVKLARIRIATYDEPVPTYEEIIEKREARIEKRKVNRKKEEVEEEVEENIKGVNNMKNLEKLSNIKTIKTLENYIISRVKQETDDIANSDYSIEELLDYKESEIISNHKHLTIISQNFSNLVNFYDYLLYKMIGEFQGTFNKYLKEEATDYIHNLI